MKRDLSLFGSAIARRRKSLGLTQVQLADLAECSIPYLVALEGGKPSVRLDKLGDVLEALGLQLRLEIGREVVTVDPYLATDGRQR